jgi:hypothetical protein
MVVIASDRLEECVAERENSSKKIDVCGIVFKESAIRSRSTEDLVEPVVRWARRLKFRDKWYMFVEKRMEGGVKSEGERRKWRRNC